ncbi:MAG: PLP-dependent aminotransferase family protein [Pseudomonadota bacterium]
MDRALFALTLDGQAKASLQAQLMRALREIVLDDPSRAGARLPASRALAEELSVSRTTVQSAYDQLISEGYLTAHRGSGTFVSRDVPHLATPPQPRPRQHESTPWPPFSIGLPDQRLLPHRLWARHLERAWRVPDPKLLARPDPFGWFPLRAAIADHLAAWRGLTCNPEQVLISSGAWEAFDILFRGLENQAQCVAIEDPCWPRLHEMLAMTGARSYALRIDREGFDVPALRPETSAVIVSPSRQYPSGISLSLARRAALLEWAVSQQGLVIEDDYDSEFRYRGQPLPSLAGIDGLQHVVYLGSFSKLISSAFRIGYVVLPERFIASARSYLRRMGPRASLVPQPALATFLQSGEFAVHLRRMRRIYAKRQTALVAALGPIQDILEVAPDPSGMHLCLPLMQAMKSHVTDTALSTSLNAVGLQVAALSDHAVLPDPPHALLLGYAAFDEEEISAAAAKLVSQLRKTVQEQ